MAERDISGVRQAVWINAERNEEIENWARQLAVSTEAVRRAIAQVGPRVEDVRRYLGK